MGFAQGSRVEAIKALMNTWLKDPGKSCANCGKDYGLEKFDVNNMCCENPLICTNQTALKHFYEDLRYLRETRANKFASSDDKSIRMGVSIPANLYSFLNMSMNRQYNEKLFNEEYDAQWFAKNFPMFQVPEEL